MTGYEYQLLAARTINKELTNKGCEMHALHGIRQPRSNIRQMLECQMKHREKAGGAE